MTTKQRDLIRYIEGHGHQARAGRGGNWLVVGSYDSHGLMHWERIRALRLTVRGWLGY